MRISILALPILLSACGTIYTSPTLNKNNENVTVHEVTMRTVTQVNADGYTPRKIPASFGAVSGSTPPVRGLTPAGVETLPARPKPAQTIVPPTLTQKPYRIGVSDVVLLATPTPTAQEALTGLASATNKRQGYTVQDDGTIAVPDVGRIAISGMTLKQAEDAVFNALVDRQIDPKFSLEVAEFNSQRISIAGAVNKPVLAPITMKPLILQDALQLAGGLSASANDDTIVRLNRGNKKYQMTIRELRARPALQRTLLINGDAVFIDQDYNIAQARAYAQERVTLASLRLSEQSQSLNEKNLALNVANNNRDNFLTKIELGAIKRDHVFLTGEVSKQGRFALPFNNTASLADALYSSQGINTDLGDPGQIYLLRLNRSGTHIDAYHVDGSDAVNMLLTTKMQLRPDDMIFVSEQRITAWNRVISKLLPSFSIGQQVR